MTKAGLDCRLVPGKDLQAVCTAVQQRVVSLLEKEGDEEGSELKALAAWAWHATMHVAYGLAQVMCRCSHPLVWCSAALSCHTATTDAAPRCLCSVFHRPKTTAATCDYIRLTKLHSPADWQCVLSVAIIR